MRFLICLFIAVNAFRCGVEAGNAGSGKGKTGTVKVLFAQQQLTGSESLVMDVGSLQLEGTDTSASIATSVSSIDLYSETASNDLLVAESATIPAGSYAKVAIRLKGDKPVRYRDEDGHDREVSLDGVSDQSFYIVQAITITENETTTIVLNLDPFKSISKPGDGKYVFNPRGDVSTHGQDKSYTGTTTIAGAKWICAYAYALQPVREDGRLLLDQPRDPTKGGSGREVEGRPSFENGQTLVKDDNADCDHAFARTPVVNGRYEFSHLLPGSYALRVFKSTGEFVDVQPDITLPRD